LSFLKIKIKKNSKIKKKKTVVFVHRLIRIIFLKKKQKKKNMEAVRKEKGSKG